MTLRTLAGQLAVRMTVVAGLLTMAGVTTYSATHWEPNMGHGHPAPSTVAAR